MPNLSSFLREHLETVAIRNEDLFRKSEKQFIEKMKEYFWSEADISEMIKFLQRKDNNNEKKTDNN